MFQVTMRFVNIRLPFVQCFLFGFLFVGCGDPAPQVHTPTGDARSALEAGLKAWSTGAQPGAVEGQATPTHFFDSRWQAGRKLAAFEIKSESSQGTERRFAVSLALKGPDQTEDTNYVVIGVNPIWVYHEADYARMLNMDDNPTAKKPKR